MVNERIILSGVRVMKDMKEKYSREYFEQFMKNRGFKSTDELTSYVMYLENVKRDHEVLKDKIANLNRWLAEEMY